MIYLEVRIKYRDNKEEFFKSFFEPSIGPDFVTIYPLEARLKLFLIAREKIDEIDYKYLCDCKK